MPETPTVTRTFRFAFWYSSATASLMGKTVLEPSTRIIAGVAFSEVVPPSRGASAEPPQATVTAKSAELHGM